MGVQGARFYRSIGQMMKALEQERGLDDLNVPIRFPPTVDVDNRSSHVSGFIAG